jgi:TRAP-type mannitol/chloroaromatic compound transport system permease small subunit
LDLPETAISRRLDGWITRLGHGLSWLWLILLIVIVANVVLRYAFGEGRIEFEEIQWHLYSVGFLLGLGYALQSDNHVRVDVVHERLSPRAQAWIELYGIILLLLPFCALILIYSVPFVSFSWAMNEVSASPGGLPLRWLIKAMLPIGFALLAIAAISRLTRVWSFLFGTPRALPSSSRGRSGADSNAAH